MRQIYRCALLLPLALVFGIQSPFAQDASRDIVLCQGQTVKFSLDPVKFVGLAGFSSIPNDILAFFAKESSSVEVRGDTRNSVFPVSHDSPAAGVGESRSPARFRIKGTEPGVQRIIFGVVDILPDESWDYRFNGKTFRLKVTVLDPATKSENKDVVDAINDGGAELDKLISSTSSQQIEAAATALKSFLQPLNITELAEKLAAAVGELDELIANPPAQIESGDLPPEQLLDRFLTISEPESSWGSGRSVTFRVSSRTSGVQFSGEVTPRIPAARGSITVRASCKSTIPIVLENLPPGSN